MAPPVQSSQHPDPGRFGGLEATISSGVRTEQDPQREEETRKATSLLLVSILSGHRGKLWLLSVNRGASVNGIRVTRHQLPPICNVDPSSNKPPPHKRDNNKDPNIPALTRSFLIMGLH